MAKTWVVYRRPLNDDPAGAVGVCTAAEWAAMTAAVPGALVLLRDGIAGEAEAEQAARREAMTRPASPARNPTEGG